MSVMNSAGSYINSIYYSWNSHKNNYGKVAAWAVFFFIGYGVYLALKVVYRCYQVSPSKGRVNSISTKILLKDPISAGLAAFDNSSVKGQIHGIYTTTNETQLAATCQFLKEHPRPHADLRTIHIGCATWHNFDIMCERQSSYGLIIDFNPKNAEFIEKTIEIINDSKSRDDFIQQMIIYLDSLSGEQRDLFFHGDQQGLPTDRIKKERLREGSWLRAEENYLFIKKIASQGRLIAITEDITNCETFSRIRKFLNSNKIVIDTLYLSNICNFMNTASKKDSFVKSIKQLLNQDTIFINCPKLIKPNSAHALLLQQQPILGKEILANSYDNKKLFEKML